MADVRVLNNRSPDPKIRYALTVTADILGVDTCWYYGGSFHFRLPSDWTVSLTPESAGRVCVQTWFRLRCRDTKWSRCDDRNRLAYLIREALSTAMQPA